jgi:GTP pyrophosphokinase
MPYPRAETEDEFTMSYSERFDRALMLASELHRDQVRKGTAIPYVTHLLAVASLVGETGGNEDEVIAALLHDAVEDQGGAATLATIRAIFGIEVADVVAGCTDADTIPKPPWRARKEAYLAHLPRASASVRHVSCADKLHNARCLLADLRESGSATWDRFNGGREGTLWYYRELVSIYRQHGAPPRLLTELERVVKAIEELERPSSSRDSWK